MVALENTTRGEDQEEDKGPTELCFFLDAILKCERPLDTFVAFDPYKTCRRCGDYVLSAPYMS
jgi:hypothetical protein